MKLDTTAKVFEILSGVAILVTLVLLVIEVRENTQAVQRSTFNQLSNNLILWREVLVSNDDLFDDWYRQVKEDKELPEKEFKRLTVHTELLWLTYEQAYFSQLSGFIGDAEWRRFDGWICRKNFGPRRVWEEIRISMSGEFIQYVENCRPEWKRDAGAKHKVPVPPFKMR